MYAVMGCLVALLVLWIFQRAVVQHRARLRYQASCAHNWKRIHAWDDIRFPVDICQICGKQESVRKPILCPHCGKDMRG